jgi:hypothetical protein
VPDPVSLLGTAYRALSEALIDVAAGGDGWAPTGCRGWPRVAAFPLFG